MKKPLGPGGDRLGPTFEEVVFLSREDHLEVATTVVVID